MVTGDLDFCYCGYPETPGLHFNSGGRDCEPDDQLCALGPARPSWTFERWCDCDVRAHHRWNCITSPIYAQVIRDLDTHPWTVFQLSDEVAMASALNGEWT